MTAEKEEKKPAANQTTPAGGQQMKIRWDDSSMRSVYANVCNVVGTREEIVFFFGMNQSWDATQKELTVQVTERIVMSPFAAKRLGILLNNVVRDYESRYGALDVEARRTGE